MTTWGPGWGPTNQIRCALETGDQVPLPASQFLPLFPRLETSEVKHPSSLFGIWITVMSHSQYTREHSHRSARAQIWNCGSTSPRPSLVRHPISPTVCSTNIWRMGQVIKRIAFPSCFVTSLCHFNFSSRLYRLDTGMWISICDTNKRNSLFSELLQFNIIQWMDMNNLDLRYLSIHWDNTSSIPTSQQCNPIIALIHSTLFIYYLGF